MKKRVIFVAMALVLAMAATAGAQDLHFSDKEWQEIVKITQESYPGARVLACRMTQRWLRIKIITANPDQEIRLDAFLAKGRVDVDRMSHKDMALATEIIRARVESILNRPAQEALRR